MRPQRAIALAIGVGVLVGGELFPSIVSASTLPTVRGPSEGVAVAGAPSPSWTPDTHIAVYGSGSTTEWYLVQATKTFRYVGASLATARANPAGAVTGPSGSGYARDYEGISSVIRPATATGNYRIGFTHAERHCRAKGQEWKVLASIGLVISSDAGVSWTSRGQLITSQVATTECAGFTGVGQPDALIVGGYVYVFFTDWTPDRANWISVARAPLASAADPLAYRKFDGASGWTPARGGVDVAVIARPTTSASFAAGPSVSWNATLGEYLAVFETDLGFYEATSANLLSWSGATSLLAFPKARSKLTSTDPWWAYPTLLSTSSPSGATGSSNYLYFARGIWGGGTPHTLVRVWVPIGTPALPAALNITAGASWHPSISQSVFAWACTGDIEVSVAGTTTPLYDSDQHTGLVLGLMPGSEITTVGAPWGATCAPAYPSDLASAEQKAAASLMASGCGGVCTSVTTVTYDPLGHPDMGPLPSAVWIAPGTSWTPSDVTAVFAWVCTGDVGVTVNGVTVALYDDLASTGLVVGVAPAARVTVTAPWGASCAAAYPWNLAPASDGAVTAAKGSGCGRACVSVREVEYGADGRMLVDAWW